MNRLSLVKGFLGVLLVIGTAACNPLPQIIGMGGIIRPPDRPPCSRLEIVSQPAHRNRWLSSDMRAKRSGKFRYGGFGFHSAWLFLKYADDPRIEGIALALRPFSWKPEGTLCVHIQCGELAGSIGVPDLSGIPTEVPVDAVSMFRRTSGEWRREGSLKDLLNTSKACDLNFRIFTATSEHRRASLLQSIVFDRPAARTSEYEGVSCGTGGCQRLSGESEADVEADYELSEQ